MKRLIISLIAYTCFVGFSAHAEASIYSVDDYIRVQNDALESFRYTDEVVYTVEIDPTITPAVKALRKPEKALMQYLSDEAILEYLWTIGFGSTYTMTQPNGLNTLYLVQSTTDNAADREWARKEISTIIATIQQKYAPTTTWDVLVAIDDYIRNRFTYNLHPTSQSNPYLISDFLKSNQGVCQAYAVLAYELLNGFGLNAKVLMGEVPSMNWANGPLHSWVGVQIGTDWYHYDPTWNATSQSTRYLAVSEDFFKGEGHPRIIFNPIAAPSKEAIQTEPYDFAAGIQTAAHKEKLQYSKHFDLTTRYTTDGLELLAPFLSTLYKHEVEITVNGELIIYIDGQIVKTEDVEKGYVLPRQTLEYDTLIVEHHNVLSTKDKTPFIDITSSYATEQIQYLYQQQIIRGTSEQYFSPKNSLTRGHMIAIIGRYLGQKDAAAFEVEGLGYHWAASHFQYLQNAGYMPAKYDAFNGHEPIRRIEAAYLLYNLLRDTEQLLTIGAPFADTFSSGDDETVARSLRAAGIFDGDPNGHFNPNSPLTREQFAKIFYNTIQLKE